MRARGFVTFRLSAPVTPPTAMFLIDAGTVLVCQRPGGLLAYRTVLPYAIVAGHSAVEVEVEATAHGSDHNLPPMNTLLIVESEHLRLMNQRGELDVHNVQGFIAGTDDEVERVRPVPDAALLMGDAVPAWNDSMRRITEMEQARERQRQDPARRVSVDGASYYIDSRLDSADGMNTSFTLTSASSDDSVISLGNGASYTWNPVTNQPVDTSVPYDRGDWTTWFYGRGLDHEGEPWVWRIRSSFEDARPCPQCDAGARSAAERGNMVVRCGLCARQIMVVPARAAEAEPVAQWTREPTLMEVWAD
jgi:hypothetical protein